MSKRVKKDYDGFWCLEKKVNLLNHFLIENNHFLKTFGDTDNETQLEFFS